MLNNVSIMGRLVRDPELRRTQSGIAVTTMRIAVDRDFKGQDGAKQADFFDVVAWRGTAEFASRYFFKGRMIVVDGRLQTREWNDREGNKRTSVEIVADNIYFGDSKRDNPNNNGDYGSAPGYGAPSGGYGSGYGASSGGYGSAPGYGAPSGGYASGYGNSSGNYGSAPGYGNSSGGYGSASGFGAPSGASSGGYGSASGFGSSYGGYGASSGAGYGSYDNAAPAAAPAPSGSEESPAPSADAAPADDPAPSGFAELADDDGDLPF